MLHFKGFCHSLRATEFSQAVAISADVLTITWRGRVLHFNKDFFSSNKKALTKTDPKLKQPG